MDLTVGVSLPPPTPLYPDTAARPSLPPPEMSGPPVSARTVVSPSKRLVTVVVDVDLPKALANQRASATAAAAALLEKLRAASQGDDMSELRIISLGEHTPLRLMP